MRRFTLPAPSPAIDNCWIETEMESPKCPENAAPLPGAGGLALARHGVFGRPAHQRGIVVAEEYLAEADRGLDLHLAVGAPPDIATAQRLHQSLGRLLDVVLQVGISPQRHLVDCELAGIGAAHRNEI